jgi:hypothetical protein
MTFRGWQFGLWLIALLTSGPVQAEDWQLKSDRDGIRIYHQHRQARDKQLHTLGMLRVKASPQAVLALIKDLDACPRWIYGCLSARRLPDGLIHMVFAGPLWFKDRDIVFSSRLTYLKSTNQWYLAVENQPHQHPNPDKAVRRLRHFSTSWLLTPVNPEETHVSHQLYMDPELGIKAGVNKYNRSSTRQTLQAMRELLAEPVYQQATGWPDEVAQSARSAKD